MPRGITILGSVNLDHVVRVPHFPEPGETLTGTHYEVFNGGKGANQALATARALPASVSSDALPPVHFLAAIGQDAGGRALVQALSDDGVNTDHVLELSGERTGVALIQVNAEGENCITIVPNANGQFQSLTSEQTDVLARTSWLLVQHEVPHALNQAAIRQVRISGGQVVLNPAPMRDFELSMLTDVDILTPNETELEALTGIPVSDETSLASACRIMHQAGVPTVLVTLGARGVWLSQQHEDGVLIPGKTVKAVDTTGAGDTFNGALVSQLAQGTSIKEAIRFAQAAAALAVTVAGAQPAIPRAPDIKQFLEQ